MLCPVLSHITQHFHAFRISCANILTSYTLLTVAKTSFKQLPFVAHRRSPNLRDLLVKAQLPVISNTHFPLSFFSCGQNYTTCPYITNGLTSYTFYTTGETRSITSHITCNTKNVIYMVQINVTVVIYNI